MAAGMCTALASEIKKSGRAGSEAEKSNPTNLRRVPGDDKDAQMTRPGIRGDKEKSVFLRIVTFRSSFQLFAVAKGNLGFAALVLHVKFLRTSVPSPRAVSCSGERWKRSFCAERSWM